MSIEDDYNNALTKHRLIGNPSRVMDFDAVVKSREQRATWEDLTPEEQTRIKKTFAPMVFAFATSFIMVLVTTALGIIPVLAGVVYAIIAAPSLIYLVTTLRRNAIRRATASRFLELDPNVAIDASVLGDIGDDELLAMSLRERWDHARRATRP